MLEIDQRVSMKRIYDRVVNELIDSIDDENLSMNRKQVREICTTLFTVLHQCFLQGDL